MANVTESDIRRQSINCYSQWAEQWRVQAKYHGDRFDMHSLDDLFQTGVGKAALCIANGYSFEENLKTIQKHKGNVDIVACDKTVGHCLENGLTPKYVILCDANVSFEKYLEPYADKLQDTILIANVCGNPKWATLGNWKKVYFFINEDVLESEKEFYELSKCPNTIIAGTNVSNAMVIMLTQCRNETGAKNFFGYDKILLIGFDFSWDENYYAFDKDGGGKINYMKNVFLKDLRGEFIFTSPNLMFSAKWFDQYIRAFGLPVFQCSKRSIVTGNRVCDLDEQMQYTYNPTDSQLVQRLVKIREDAQQKLKEVQQKLNKIAFDHMLAVKRSV